MSGLEHTGRLLDGMDDNGLFELDFLGIDDFLDDDLEEEIEEEIEDLFQTQDLFPEKLPKKRHGLPLFEDEAPCRPNLSQTQELPDIHRRLPKPAEIHDTKPTKAIPVIRPVRAKPVVSAPKPKRIDMGMPVRIHGHGNAVHVFIGPWSIRFIGVWHRGQFRVNAADIQSWGLSGGPSVTKEEREKLMWILSEKSSPSPWLRLVFYDERGMRIHYGRDGTRRQPGIARYFGRLHRNPDNGDHADRRDAPGL